MVHGDPYVPNMISESKLLWIGISKVMKASHELKKDAEVLTRSIRNVGHHAPLTSQLMQLIQAYGQCVTKKNRLRLAQAVSQIL